MSIRPLTLSLVALVVPVLSASAQNRKIEIGFDGSLQVQVSDEGTKYTQISLPGGVVFPEAGLRIAFPLSDLIAIEPMLGGSRVSVDEEGGGESFSAFRGILGLIITPTSDPSVTHFYLRPYGGIDLLSSDGETDTQFLAGGSVGLRVPLDDRLSFRTEAGYAHGFENEDIVRRNFVVLRVGLSMYLK